MKTELPTLTPDALATLIYTSGTTGKPKGVRLAHDGWTYEGYALRATGDLMTEDDLEFRWLPMAHSFGKVLLTAQLAVGYAAAIDGRVPKIVENLAIIKPTFMGAAPRIFEKAYGGINAMMEKEGGAKLKLFRWAEKVGLEHSRAVRSGKPVSPALKAKFALADKLIFSKVRERFGGRVRFFISGSAALSRDIGEWFHAAGMLILEGYGLTETSAGATCNRPDAFKLGTVGLPLPGSEVKIAEDGEVLLKGPHIMRGYHNLPDETGAAMLDDGGSPRATSARSTTTASSDHRPQEGPVQDVRRQVHRADVHRGHVQGDHAAGRQRPRARQRAQLLLGPHHAGT